MKTSLKLQFQYAWQVSVSVLFLANLKGQPWKETQSLSLPHPLYL